MSCRMSMSPCLIFAESMTDHDYDLLDAIEVVLEQFDRAVRP